VQYLGKFTYLITGAGAVLAAAGLYNADYVEFAVGAGITTYSLFNLRAEHQHIKKIGDLEQKVKTLTQEKNAFASELKKYEKPAKPEKHPKHPKYRTK
jgi:hypothetical protein